jgi:glucose dehydrogenase
LPEGKRNTGLPYGPSGPTASAGDLLFYAALSDARLRAFNSVTGDELWSAELPGAAITQPVTFLGSDGRQYVSITVAGRVKAFALPRE